MPVKKAQINPVQDITMPAFSVKANKDSYGFFSQVTTKKFGHHYVMWFQGHWHKPRSWQVEHQQP